MKMYVRTPTLSKFRLQGSSESVPYLKSSSMATLLGVYFYLLSLAIFFFLAAGSQVPSVLWLTIISTTWSRKRAHVMQVRLKMRVSPCASPPPPKSEDLGTCPPSPRFRHLWSYKSSRQAFASCTKLLVDVLSLSVFGGNCVWMPLCTEKQARTATYIITRNATFRQTNVDSSSC